MLDHILITVGITVLTTHTIASLLMTSVWLWRKATRTWRLHESDWDTAQSGAVLHGVSILIAFLSVGMAHVFPLQAAPVIVAFASFLVSLIGVAMWMLASVDTFDNFPAKTFVNASSNVCLWSMGGMILLAFISGGNAKEGDSLLVVFAFAMILVALSGSATYAGVVYYSFQEGREILRTGARNLY